MKDNVFKQYEASGFTLIELMIVISIMSLIAALALPNMGGMIKEYKLRSAASQMVASLQSVKMRAVKENAEVKIFHQIDGVTGEHYYQLFVDSNDDNVIDAGEAYARVTLDKNLTITSNFRANVFGFTSRGLPSNGNGTVSVNLTGGRSISIIISKYGNVRVL